MITMNLNCAYQKRNDLNLVSIKHSINKVLKMIAEIALALFVGLLVTTIAYLLRFRGTLEAYGIPVVKPVLIFGSPPFLLHKLPLYKDNFETHKKLGKTFGRYVGRIPAIVTIDPDLIKEILVIS
jgi:hypothetical protein